ncbi:MAG: toll/interleukin-1 receptor domain-containing protein, partial [Chitinophagales bacterium]
ALIVRKSSYLISHEHIWYNGCFFIFNDSIALVKAESKNKIQIMSSGTQKGLLLEVLSHEIDMINKSFSFTFEINVKKQIQCICKLCLTSPTPTFHDFNDLIDRLNRGKKDYVECLKSDENVIINELLDYTFDRGKNKLLLDKKSVFISYSKNDIAHLTNFKKHLKVISSKVNIWDDNTVKVGDKWEDKITELISIANIIVFLISADMYSTDFIMEVELPQALQRQKNDPDNVRIIPVIIKECLWQETILAVFNGSPNKGVPITNFENSDAAWTKVVSEINNLLNEM